MSLKLTICRIKWFFILKYYLIKQYVYCKFFHKNKRCYPRVDIADEKEHKKHWHCRKCVPCGMGIDYLLETSGIKNDK